jgi:rhodanese-related sulfurtransferase
MAATISPDDLYVRLKDDDELALLDVREEGVFGVDGHLLFAVCLPLSRLELDIRALVPRKSVRVVLCDGGEGLTVLAAEKLERWGYGDVSILEGGVPAWEAAGYVVFRGVNVPSKAFGEFVEHQSDTPNVGPEDLKAMIDRGDNMIVLDSRPWGEYRRMNIPTGIDCPGAELAYRVHDLVRDPDKTIVVNCAGRTRSIIGAQSLINAGVTNRVFALRNGTMGWALAGFDLETGSERNFPEITEAGSAAAQACAATVANRYGVQKIDHATLEAWRNESDQRSLFVLDVRNPEEFLAGHLPGSLSAPGGQLVQATDKWVGTLRSRIVLVDDSGVRATMTASWLIQMGWPEVVVLENALDGVVLDSGAPDADLPEETGAALQTVTASELQASLEAGGVAVIDLATSLEYKASHIPGAFWAVRARLDEALAKAPADATLVFTGSDSALARLTAADALAAGRMVNLLEGGNGGWVSSGFATETGFENMTTANNDVQYKAYDHDENIEFHMQEYLSWEIGLVGLVDKDATARFRHIPA